MQTEVLLNVIEHFRVVPDLDIYMAQRTSFFFRIDVIKKLNSQRELQSNISN